MTQKIDQSTSLVERYIKGENYKGYDPYDTLNSTWPLQKFGKWIPILATQFQKRNPVHIRPFLGIKKEANPKGLGLILNAMVKQYRLTDKQFYLHECRYLIDQLVELRSTGYDYYCWGYNFPWASPLKTVPAYHPSVVVTAFIVKGLYEYYLLTRQEHIKKMIVSAAQYVLKDLPRIRTDHGICISYTDLQMDVCYNANLLGAEILSYAHKLTGDKEYKRIARAALDFTFHYQHKDGHWNYSRDMHTETERKQIDFHQGYVLESAHIIIQNCGLDNEYNPYLAKGLQFYKEEQFFENGRSLWRLPKKWPVEIHNQSQGVITFSKLTDYGLDYAPFAKKIARWTIENMQDEKGFFYYHMHRFFTIKIPYMRWSQAWMYLALTDLKYYSQ